MDKFQTILIVIGLIAIIGVSLHGFLTHRKEQKSLLKNISAQPQTLDEFNETDEFSEVIEAKNSSVEFQDTEVKENLDDVDFSENFYSSNETPLEFENEISTEASNESENIEEDATLSDELQFESDIVDDEMSNSAIEEEITLNHDLEIIPEIKDADEDINKETDLFIFNVVAKNDETLGGHELLQYFLTSGFRYGDMSIFHRHEHSDGTGPVLFSLANMMSPGVFDLDTMEQFKSEGVSFFLTAPNDEINVTEAFKMMLTAVEIMAEEFDCIVLNGNREELTESQFIEYQDRLAKYS